MVKRRSRRTAARCHGLDLQTARELWLGLFREARQAARPARLRVGGRHAQEDPASASAQSSSAARPISSSASKEDVASRSIDLRRREGRRSPPGRTAVFKGGATIQTLRACSPRGCTRARLSSSCRAGPPLIRRIARP